MQNIVLYDDDGHRFVLLNESEAGLEDGVRSNQFLLQRGEHGILIDPGGFGVMPAVLAEMLRYIEPGNLRAIVLSHQDPDIVGGLSAWLELTSAPAYISALWTRFLPHYGIRGHHDFVAVPDAGMALDVAPDFRVELLPAHFLHSEGQINLYDPVSKILFSGDIGAAMLPPGHDPAFVDDFAAHLPYIEGFHRRYMGSNRAARLWVEQVSRLDVAMIASQHGPVYRGRAVADFLAWFRELECGIDLMTSAGSFRRPGA